MIELRALGSLELSSDSSSTITSVLAQRRRTALLCYLAIARPHGYHARETLSALFWPEHDAEQARHALRQMLYFLRRSLGVDSIVSRGDDAVALSREHIHCDVWEFDRALNDGRFERALELYRGDLLPGFGISDSAEFERWLEDERASCRLRAANAAWALSEKSERSGDAVNAAAWARRATEFSPADETVLRRLILLLDRLGDRAAALRAYDVFVAKLATEYELEPSEETRALVARIRNGQNGRTTNGAAAEGVHETRTIATDVLARQRTEASQQQPEAAAPISNQRRGRRAAMYGAAAVLTSALILVVSLFGSNASDSSACATEPSIVVLPFSSPNPADAPLAAGMTEELRTRLFRGCKLRVISSTSSSAFADRKTDTRTIASILNVGNILEGSLQKNGDTLRVTAALADPNGTTLWRDVFTLDVHDVFAVQNEIARAIANKLNVRLLEPRNPPPTPTAQYIAAWELFQKGNDPVLFRSDSGRRRLLELYRQVVATDSTFAPAYAALALLHTKPEGSADSKLAYREGVDSAEIQARKAIALDPMLGQAYHTLARVHLRRFELGVADSLLRLAIELDPSWTLSRQDLAHLYIFRGQRKEALAEARRIVASDPTSASFRVELARALIVDGKCKDALREFDQLGKLEQPILRMAPLKTQCYAEQKQWSMAIETMRASTQRAAYGDGLLAYMLARGGFREEAERMLASLMQKFETGSGPAFPVAIAYAGFGDRDQAFHWLDKATEDRSLFFSIMEPAFRELRHDRRFESIARRIGIQEWKY